MQALDIAIIGAGTAGLAAACFLRQSGHQVVVYERFDAPKPLGAGLLLQPTGLAVLGKLGLDKAIIANGSRIDRLHGTVVGSKIATLKIAYKDFNAHYFGIGAHRGDLFNALHDKVIDSGIPVIASTQIDAIEMEGAQSHLTDAAGHKSQGFDLVIDCSGAKSQLRAIYADVKLNKPYPYGALWGMVEIADGDPFHLDTLDQRYKNAYHMIGVLPVGRNADNTATRAAFFWSLRVKDYPHWRASDLAAWRNYVASLWPETARLLAQFKTHDDLTLGTYSDVILRRYHRGNIVFIGDAAHCTSPQLGQGANLALVDACVLDECLNSHPTIAQALQAYTRQRKDHVRLYQLASRVLTPFFQSDGLVLAKIRFLLCGIACRIPFTRKITAQLLSGTKTGMFSLLDPGRWTPDYALRKRAAKASIA